MQTYVPSTWGVRNLGEDRSVDMCIVLSAPRKHSGGTAAVESVIYNRSIYYSWYTTVISTLGRGTCSIN